MAYLTSGQISNLAVSLLSRDIVLPATVARVPGGEFAGSNGDTVTVRVPQPGTAQTQTIAGDGPITYEDISEVGVDVSLKHLYHATKVTDEDLSLAIEDFGAQVTRVQVNALATKAEDQIVAAMNGLTAENATTPPDATNVESLILEARQALSSANVPAGERTLAVSPEFATHLLSLDKFVRVDASGNDNALRDATLGRLYGFNIVESNGLTANTAVAYHRSGFVFANRVPVSPRGAADSSTASAGRIGMRHIFQYQPDFLSDASVLSTFAGAAVVDAKRVWKIG